MLNWFIDFSLRHRFLVILVTLALAAAGVLSLAHLDIDAFPDTTPVQIQINTIAPSLAPEEVERQITFPIEQAISGLPGLEKLRSISKFGLSQVVVTFQDGTDIYFARQLVNERLGTVELPEGIERPQMGPVSTGLGEVFHYVLTYEGYDFSKLPDEERVKKLTELRTIHDWVVKPQLRSIPGVAEVNSWGGYEKQYQVRIDPDRLVKHGLTFDQVMQAVEDNNRNVGGGSISVGSRMLLGPGSRPHRQRRADREHRDHGQGWRADPRPRRGRRADRPRDPPRGGHGPRPRRSGARPGLHAHGREQPRGHLGAEEQAGRDQGARSPPGVTIQTVYDRTELVDHVIDTVRKNLFEGGLLVIADPVHLPRQSSGRADRGPGDSAVDAVCLLRDAAVRHCRQPAEPGGDRLRHDRR